MVVGVELKARQMYRDSQLASASLFPSVSDQFLNCLTAVIGSRLLLFYVGFETLLQYFKLRLANVHLHFGDIVSQAFAIDSSLKRKRT